MNDEALTLDAKRCVLIIQDMQIDVMMEGGAWADTGAPEHAKEQNVVENIKVPENTGNLSWGGEDWHTLFIPSSTSLYSIRTIVGPRREPYMR
jgi:hypothetical protein